MIRADQHFSIIPEWVLYADVSAQAVRLYCVLRRYADQEGRSTPSRKTLAAKLNAKDPKVADRALRELVRIGAVRIEHRPVPGKAEADTNVYWVASAPPEVVVEKEVVVETPRQVVVETPQEREPVEREVLASKDREASTPTKNDQDVEAPPAGTVAGTSGRHPGRAQERRERAPQGATTGLARPDTAPDARVSAASTRPTEEQHYLLTDKLWVFEPSWRRKLTHGALVKLNREFGVVAVTELLRFMKADLVEGRLQVEAPFPWMRSALSAREEVKLVAVHR